MIFHCEECEKLANESEEDFRMPQACAVCRDKGYIGNLVGPVSPCAACTKGNRFGRWLIHEKTAGHWIPSGVSI